MKIVRYREIVRAAMFASASLFAIAAQAEGLSSTAPPEGETAAPDNEDQSAGTGEIIVTAERRESSIQKTPIAVSAVSGELLQERRIQTIRDLAAELPSVLTPGQFQSMQSIIIRGVGSSDPGVYPAVAIYVDDVYIPRTFGTGLIDLPDIERVEVLRGPQGTLYGLNTTGGAMKFVSRKPSNDTTGHLDIGVGSYGNFETHVYVSGPIVADRLAASFAYSRRRSDGHLYNAFKDAKADAIRTDLARAKLRWTPAGEGGFEATLSVDVAIDRSDNESYTPVGYPGADENTTFGDFNQRLVRDAGGASLQLAWPVSDAITLKSITAYRQLNDDPAPYDQDGTPELKYGWNQYIDEEEVTQEFQFLGDFGALKLIAGANYFYESFNYSRNIYRSPTNYRLTVSGLTDNNYGLFGQLDYAIDDRLSVTVGARINRDSQEFANGSYISNAQNERISAIYEIGAAKEAWTTFTPKFALNYRWSDKVLTYASFSKGAKAGGFNRNATTAQIAEVPVAPEKVQTYEIGLKANALGNRLRTAVAAFHTNYGDYISSVTNPEINGQPILGAVLVNAAKARIYGFEGEISLEPFAGLRLAGNAAWLDTKFQSFANPTGAADQDYTGNRLPNAPRWTLGGSATFETAVGDLGDLSLSGRARYHTLAYGDAANTETLSARTFVDLTSRFKLAGGHWSVIGNVSNLFDKRYVVGSRNTPSLGVNTRAYSRPRQFTATLRYDF